MPNENKEIYTQKARYYARYRWDYAPKSVETIMTVAGLNQNSVLADVGAGTGKLSRHFIDRVGQIYLVEPNDDMRNVAAAELEQCAACRFIDAAAEQTTLPDHSIDIITVAQAIHWFDPEPTRREFRRILKPGGWLAVLRNIGLDDAASQATGELYSPEYGFEPQRSPRSRQWKPLIYFYGNGRFQVIRFPFTFEQDFERFFGAILSTAGMPDEFHPRFYALEQAAQRIFERLSENGKMQVHGETELFIGQVSGI